MRGVLDHDLCRLERDLKALGQYTIALQGVCNSLYSMFAGSEIRRRERASARARQGWLARQREDAALIAEQGPSHRVHRGMKKEEDDEYKNEEEEASTTDQSMKRRLCEKMEKGERKNQGEREAE